VKEIALSKGMVAVIDDEDYDKVIVHAWHYKQSRNTGYARTGLRKPARRGAAMYIRLSWAWLPV
jgi:hypothetical protein